MNLCDHAFEDCSKFMRDYYESYYRDVERLALAFQELIGRPFELDLWGEMIELNHFYNFYTQYVKREMSLDELTVAKRTLKRLVEEQLEK